MLKPNSVIRIAGEWLAVVRGHQSGGEGTWAAMPSLRSGD